MRNLAILLVLLSTGCSQWTHDTGEPLALPAPRIPTDAVILEVAFIDFPYDDDVGYEALWQEIDETIVPMDQREAFAANGLRWGIVPATIPAVLQDKLAEAAADADQSAQLGRQLNLRGSATAPTARRLQLRPGRNATVVVDRAVDDTFVMLWREDGVARGVALDKAECQFELEVDTGGGGDVRLTLVPRVEYGEAKPRMVGHEGTWMVQTERERLVLEALTMQASLSPGQILIVGSDRPPLAVGGSFFARGWHDRLPQRILMIRLAGAAHDGLFESPETAD